MPVLGLIPDKPLESWPLTGRIGILDLEFTSWDGSWQRGWSEPWEWREIVQIGILIVDVGKAFSKIEGKEVMVIPQRNPVLSTYFQRLTGITQAELHSKGVDFESAVSEIQPYLKKLDVLIFNGQDGQILRENCSFNGVKFPWKSLKMFNFRPLLAKSLGLSQGDLISSTLPTLAGLTNFGKAHTALDDCNAIAIALAIWRKEGKI